MYLNDDNALRIDYARCTVEDWKNAGLLDENEYYYLVACIVEGIRLYPILPVRTVRITRAGNGAAIKI